MRITICLLSYKRPAMLEACVRSLFETKVEPVQLIINSDGNDFENNNYLYTLYQQKKVSSLILNNGSNRGVGRSLQNCLGMAEGDLIMKVDTDLVFLPGWQEVTRSIMYDNPDIGSLSLFDYRHYDPNDTRFKIEFERSDCFIVNDFVSSVYAVRAEEIRKMYPVTDDGIHSRFAPLAITKRDYVRNQGFGVGKSVYVSGTVEHPFKTPTFSQPFRM